jgi:cell wall-associated NlpC family hydrolase
MQQPHPYGGRRLLRLAFWSAVVGLAWLLLGQQYAGQPAIHLNLAAGPIAPAHPAPTPRRQTAPAASPQRSTGTSHAPARAVAFALAQQGKPYMWGAEGPEAYDCSGLTWLAWQHAGLAWTRMSAVAQWAWLHQHHRDVAAAQLQPGDLLFYADNPHDPASIHHVAMHVGNGRMVEAYAPGYPVRVTSVRWNGFYAAARPAL